MKRPALMAAQVMRVITVATVARIQDAIAVGDQYPDNPFNADIMKHPLYRWESRLATSRVWQHHLC